MMREQTAPGRTVVAAILLSGLLVIAALAVVVVAVVTVAAAVSRAADSGIFFWASVAAGAAALAVGGFLGGRLTARRLRPAGMRRGWKRDAVAVTGPALVALFWFLPSGVGGPLLGIAAMLFAAASSLVGVRLYR